MHITTITHSKYINIYIHNSYIHTDIHIHIYNDTPTKPQYTQTSQHTKPTQHHSIHTCIYNYIQKAMCKYVYTCIHITNNYINNNTYVYQQTHTYIHNPDLTTYMHTNTCIQKQHTYTSLHITHQSIHTHTYIHTYMHTHNTYILNTLNK